MKVTENKIDNLNLELTLEVAAADYAEIEKKKLAELKPKLTDLKHIRYNYDVLERDAAPIDHHIDLRWGQDR